MSNFGSIPSMMVGNASICTKYIFDASAQTVRVGEDITRFLMIINVTDGIVIYNPANPSTHGTSSGNMVTLTFDTTSMSDDDDLMVFCDVVKTTLTTKDVVLASVMNELLTEIRLTNFYLYNFPHYLNDGLSFTDEPDKLRNEFNRGRK